MIAMRGIDELDHYEMLEVSRGATPGEIDRAYRLAQETYAEGSLALYSIFEKRDASEIRSRLDEAYRVLADPELRAGYDQSHRAPDQSEESDSGVQDLGARSASRESNFGPYEASAREVSARVGAAAEAAVSQVFDEGAERYDGREDDLNGDFDGPRLRRTRLFRGYEIEQIADVTKVAGTHLRNIEDENFSDLPADVYVRGFVTAYAKTIGLDPQIVVPSYMTRLQESRQQTQRSRFLGLR
jgi:DnaJ-class molecular chaperone